VTSIDISTVAVEAAEAQRSERNLHNAEFIEMNAESLDFEDDSFDVVLGQGILHHLDMARAVSECARVLKPTGRLIATEPMGNNPAINLYRSRTPDQRTDDEHPFRTRDFDLLEEGFEEVRLQFFHFLSLGALALSRTKSFDRALHSLERADEKIFDKLPWSRNLAWMVVIEAINPRK
jgi:SAM-dependent methyltransferase